MFASSNVTGVVEKPDKPKSQFGILPLYYFKSDIFSSLKKIKPGTQAVILAGGLGTRIS